MSDEMKTVDTKANPQTAEEYQQRAWKYHTNKDQERAEADFRQALALDASSIDAQYGLAMTLKFMGKADQAVESFKKLIELLEHEDHQGDRVRTDMLIYLAKSHIQALQN